jgi:hypothetical protein
MGSYDWTESNSVKYNRRCLFYTQIAEGKSLLHEVAILAVAGYSRSSISIDSTSSDSTNHDQNYSGKTFHLY